MVMLLLLTVVILADISLISAWSKTANVSTEILFLASQYTNISTNPGWSLLEPPTFKRYTHYDLLYTTLSKIHSTCPEITRVYDIGRSVLDRKLWVLTLGDHPDVHEPGEPEVKLIANIHGNEPIGRELLIRLGWMFCLNYGQNPLITSLLDNTQIHLLPSLNPDGFEVSTEGDIDSSLGRANEHEVDLNRNFPDQYYQTNDNSRQEPETSAIIAWTHSRPFVLSASLHAGALVGVYPFDGSINRTAYYHASPDDATFRHLATTYSRAHKRMHSGHVACHNESFVDGIVNGNRWYPVFGGMQDWNYVHSGCMEITLELGCVKYPKADQIVRYWDENKYALLVLISEVHRALRGFVLDAHTHKSIGNASIHVLGNAHVVRSTLDLGEYWRLLPPSGVYHLWASKPGYFVSARITINASELPFVRHTHSEQLNFTIWPDLTSEWSPELDFNITKNRLPSYFTEPDVRAAIKASVYGDFITLGQISYSTDHLKADLVGVEIALAPKGLRKPASTALWGSSKPIHKLAGHIRVLLLAGVHGCDYVSTEMALRLLRHYAKGLELLDRSIGHLLSIQLVVLPYLDADDINRSIRHLRSTSTNATADELVENSLPSSCKGYGSQISQILQSGIRDFIYTFKPHLLLTLESDIWPNHEWRARDHSVFLPVKPIFFGDSGVTGVKMHELVTDLAIRYGVGARLRGHFGDDCATMEQSSLSSESAKPSGVHAQLADILTTASRLVYTDSLPPVALAIRVGCPVHPFSTVSPQLLPELWHNTLQGLTNLLSAVRNLSFHGQLLVESSQLTAELASVPLRRFGRDWVAVPSSQILVQSAEFLSNPSESLTLQHLKGISDHNNSSDVLSIPLDPSTGLFCSLLPTGTYLAFASAGSPNSTIGLAYEEVAIAVALYPSRHNGRTHIRLERQLTEIAFGGPDDLIRRLNLHSASPGDPTRCGILTSIGKSRLGRPMYAFSLGLNITSIEPNNLTEDGEPITSEDALLNETVAPKPLFPKVIVLGNLHGDDQLVPQLLVHYVEWLCANRNQHSSVAAMLSSVQLTIIPIPNPDGLFHAWHRLPSGSSLGDDMSDDSRVQYCDNSVIDENANDFSHGGALNHALVDLWRELMHFTRNRGFLGSRWWWEDEDFSRPFTHLEPETAALVQWLRDYEPTAVFAFPTSSAPSIGYGVDPSETDYAQNITAESHNWLQFLAYLLAPGFHHLPPHCFEPALDKPSPPDHRRRGLIDPVAHSADRSDSFVSLASRSLSLASMSPQLALSEMQTEQLQHSTSFPPPLPLPAPINMGLSLCPACRSPTPIGVARVWKDFRLPSLLLGLIGHATLTAPGSFGLIGEVQSTSGEPIPWARVHFDNMRSELSTRSRINRGQFSIALPPGTFRISIRASGYLDLVELVTIDPRGGTVHRIFRMIPVSALSATTRTYLLVTAGSFVACLLSATTIWLSYRFCFRPRTPYALARRTLASRANSSSKFNDPGHDGRRGAYRLIPLGSDAYSIGDNEHESEQDALHQSMLNHALEDGDQYDLDEVPSMDIQPKTGLLLTRSKRAHSHQKPTNLPEDSGGLEEVPLV